MSVGLHVNASRVWRSCSAIARGCKGLPAGRENATGELSRSVATIPVMEQQPRLVSVNGQIGSADLGIEVGIRLRELEGRWLAVADFGATPEVGIGATAREALAASLATLGERTAAALMADPQLFGLSAQLGRLA